MKLPASRKEANRASTLLMVMVLTTCTLLILGGVLNWTTTNATLTARNNEYFRTQLAAEAATEKVLAAVLADYQAGADAAVQPNLATYRAKVPTGQENPVWTNYAFSDGQGNANQTYLQYLPPSAFRVLTAQYRDLYGFSSIYRVISNARDTKSRYNLTAAVWQDVETATIPLFQFAIFYNLDLEMNPGANMTVTGPVHCNQNIYADPGATLTFQGDVTAALDIFNRQKPGDPSADRTGTLTFQGQYDGGVSSLNLPIGLDNTPANVRKVIEPPAPAEAVDSPLGKQRLYNKADLIVTINADGSTLVTSGLVNNKATVINMAVLPSDKKFLDVTRTLYNRREVKTVKTVEIDVAKLVAWNSSASNNLPVRAITGGTKDVTILYVDDQRTMSSSEESGVVVRNGELLPPFGLTVVTPEPVYVAGHYNVKATAAGTPLLGSANTTLTKPAALMGDSITVLSGAWDLANTAYGSRTFANRVATATTVNAALLAGVVETVSGSYSGGVENFPRFLEDWSGRTLTYNGSMVVMYPSSIATGLWQGTGSTIGIYNPPTRNWAFDLNFRDPTKLPPGTPCVRVLIRGAWASIKPNTTNIVDPDALVP